MENSTSCSYIQVLYKHTLLISPPAHSPQSQASIFIWDESSPGGAHLSPPMTQEAWTELYLASWTPGENKLPRHINQ